MKRLYEDVLVKQSFPAQQISTAGTTYNNTTIGVSSGIDMRGYDEATVMMNLGTVNGTLQVSLLEGDTAVASAATAITDEAGTAADFTDTTTANDNTTRMIAIRCKDKKRYLFVKAVRVGANAKSFAVDVLLSNAKEVPVTQDNTVEFKHELP